MMPSSLERARRAFRSPPHWRWPGGTDLFSVGGGVDVVEKRRKTMRIHAIQTGTVAIKTRQLSGRGPGALRPIITLLDTTWTEPLPIYTWVIEHPEGLIVVDTGETARVAEPGYLPWWHP